MNPLKRHHLLLIGLLALTGALGGIVADVLSLWIPDPQIFDPSDDMFTARLFTLLAEKSSGNLEMGSLLGILLLPLHMFGFFLISTALAPAGKIRSLLFFVVACIMTTIGAGFHGSIALVGETAKAGHLDLFNQQMVWFQLWWLIMTSGFLFLSLILAVFQLSSKSLYPKWCLIFTPGVSGLFLSLVVWGLLQTQIPQAIIWFLMICGINLPLFIFHLVTLVVCMKNVSKDEVGLKLMDTDVVVGSAFLTTDPAGRD